MGNRTLGRIVIVGAWLLLLAAIPVLWAGDLEGRWRLVEQTYGEGSANLASSDKPFHLELRDSGGRLSGKVWSDDASRALDWPAIDLAAERPPIRILDSSLEPGSDRIRVRYRVRPVPEEDVELEIVERYRLSDGGEALVGTVEVSFHRDGKTSGSYRLERRFERTP